MHDVSSQSPQAWRLRRRAAGAGVALVVVVAAAAMLACRPPPRYSARLAAPLEAEQAARRLVTKLAAVEAAARRPGRFEAAIPEAEINGFLATDLPRNHAAILPPWIVEPRVSLEPHMVTMAARLRAGPLAPVAHATFELRLVAAGQLHCRLVRAGLGALPLPRGPLLHRLAAAVRQAGATAELRRVDGETRLVVTMPAGPGGATPRLESLAIGPGEVLLAGTTEAAR
jgi:hypothetical protein